MCKVVRAAIQKMIAVGIAAIGLAPMTGLHTAAAQTWAGNGTSPYWDVASNWNPAVVPGAGADATNGTAFTVNYRESTDSIDSFGSTGGGGFLMSGGTLSLASSFTTNGSFSMTAGNLNVASFSATGSGPLTLSGGTLNDSGTFTTSSAFTLNGGTLQNATITNPNLLSFSGNASNILDNVTLTGSGAALNINSTGFGVNSYLSIDDGFSSNSATVFNIGVTSGNSSVDAVYIDSTAGTPNPILDNATVNLGGTASRGANNIGFGNGFNGTGNTLTFGSGLTVQGVGAVGNLAQSPNALANLVNNGTISADLAGRHLDLSGADFGNITNGLTGIIQADAINSTLNIVENASTITNYGIVQSTASGATVDVGLEGGGTFTNNGTVLATAKGNITVSAQTFGNAGTLEVDSGSTLTLSSTNSTQTAGTTIVNGAMTISNSNSNTFNLQGGALYGTGTITGTLNNTGAKVGAGIEGATPSTGTLALTGNYDQLSGGTFSSALGGTTPGTQYDYFTVSGSMVLAGNLDIDLINGFTPTAGETFQIISDGSESGTFSNTTGNAVTDESGKYLFQVVYGSNGVTLTSEGTMPEPGAGSLLLAGIGPLAMTIFPRRLRREI